MYSPIGTYNNNVQSELLPNSGVDSKNLVKIFIESIKYKASDAEVFIEVSTNNDESQLIKFSHFNNQFFPNNLFGTDLNGYSVNITVSNIRSIEIMPKIGTLVQSSDKVKLEEIGITFDEKGFIIIPREKFTYKKSIGSNNYQIKISLKDGGEVAIINAKVTKHQSYCIIHWS